MNTIFQRTNISEPALFSPCDTTKQIDNFPEICVSTFSENIIQKFSSLNTFLFLSGELSDFASLILSAPTLPPSNKQKNNTKIFFIH